MLTEKDKNKVLAALDANYHAKRLQLEKETANKIVANTSAYMSLVGKAVGESLSGQKDAWKDLLSSVVDTIAAQVTAQIGMTTAAKVATQLESEDYAGAAKSAAIGALEIAAVAGLAAAAKSAIGSSNHSDTSGSGGGGGGGGGGSPAPSPSPQPTAPRGTNVTVVVQGSVVGDINELARRVSDAVQNRNVRLVATKVKGGQ